MKGLTPVQNFALYGGLCVAGLSLALGLASSSLLERHLREIDWATTAEVVKHQAEEHHLASYFADPRFRQEPARYRQAFGGLLSMPEVVRIQVWDRKATVLWSDDDRLVGKSFPENQEVKAALAGRVVAELVSPRALEQKYGGEPSTPLAEIYVPIAAKPSGEILGVIEVYKLPARLFADIRRMQVVVWGIAIAGGILLYVVLLPTVWRSYRTQLELEGRLREHAHDLEALVQERTADLARANAALQSDITERTRVEETLAARTRQLETVRTVAEEITRELDLGVLLELITRRAAEMVGGASGTIFLWDEEAQALVPRTWHGFGEWRPDVRPRLGEGVAGTVAQRREGMIVNDYRASPYVHPVILERTGITAVLAEPLLYHNRLVGVITINNGNGGTGRSFTEHDREILALFVPQAAIAIEKARLFAATEQRATELATLQEIRRAITAQLELPAVLEAVVAGAMRLLENPFAQIILWEEETQTLRYGAAMGSEAERVRNQTFQLGRGINGTVAQTRQPMIVDDYQASPFAVPECWDVVATVTVPILFGDRLLGVLHSHTTQPGRRFGPDDLRRFQMLATQAALAIENARLYEAVRQQAADLESRVRERTAELEKALQVKVQFLANMSHELRTPLNAVLGFSEILLRPGTGALTPNQERYVQQVHNGGKRLLELVADLLDMADSQTGPEDLRLDRVSVQDLFDEVVRSLAVPAKAKQVELGLVLDGNLPTVVANRDKLTQILHHLVANAVKFTPDGGRITVRARRVPGDESRGAEAQRCGGENAPLPPSPSAPLQFLELTVTDTGVGIAPADLERIFRGFEQVDSSDTRRYGGAGLGLALVRRLVELHGGRVWAESEGEGRGSTFTVVLPFSGRET